MVANTPFRVVANHNATIVVQNRDGKLFRCVARKKLGTIVAGDWVDIAQQSTGNATIETIAPRTGVLERPDHRGKPKPVAANLTRLLIVAAQRPGIDTLLIDSYIAAAERSQITPVLVINKADTLDDEMQAQIDTLFRDYRRIGYQCLLISAHAQLGVDELITTLIDQTAVLVGQSGVGKSSIVNCLLPDKSIRTGALSEATGLGGHTTTAATLYNLPAGGCLIDSPGVREFALGTIDPSMLADTFIEFAEFSDGCRFSNCIHQHEPGCAIQQAVSRQRIAGSRYENYLFLLGRTDSK